MTHDIADVDLLWPPRVLRALDAQPALLGPTRRRKDCLRVRERDVDEPVEERVQAIEERALDLALKVGRDVDLLAAARRGTGCAAGRRGRRRRAEEGVGAFFGPAGDAVRRDGHEALEGGELAQEGRDGRVVRIGAPRLEAVEDLGVCGRGHDGQLAASDGVRQAGAPRTQAEQMASTKRHLVLATSSLSVCVASPASSSAPSSLTHSMSSLRTRSSQWQLVAAFETGGTNGGSGGVALRSSALPFCDGGGGGAGAVEDEREKKDERRET